jgi:cation/acetate symporter
VLNDIQGPGFEPDGRRFDAGVGFGLAAFGVGLGLLAVLDRIGLPDRLLHLLVLALTIAGFVAAAVAQRTTRTNYFYAAGNVLPPRYSGLAAAALAAGLFVCLLPITIKDARFPSLVIGFGLGLAGAFFGTGSLLRRSTAFSLADLIATRFPRLARHSIVAIIAAACAGLVAFAGYDLAMRGLIAATGLGRAGAAAVLAAILCFLVIAGGLSTVLWVAIETMIVLVVGLALPLALDLLHGQPLALPFVGDRAVWDAAKASLAATVAGSQADHASTFSLVIAFAMGLATLTPLLGPMIASGRERGFARDGMVAFAWLGLFAVFACATLATATLTLDKILVDHAPSEVPPAIYAANAKGRVTLCGGAAANPAVLAKDCAAQKGFAGRLRLGDIRVLPEFLVENLAVLRQSGSVLDGLAQSFLVGLGLALAAAGFQSLVTSLGHDAIAPERRRLISASLRLALTRSLAIFSISLIGILLAFTSVDTGLALTFALFLSATFLAPILGLLFWPRANSRDAGVTLFATTVLLIGLMASHGPFAALTDLSSSVLLAGLGGLMAGLFSSLIRFEAGGRDAGPPAPQAAREPQPPPDQVDVLPTSSD